MTTIIGTGEVGALHSREELEEMQRLPLQRKIQITTARIIEWYQHYDGKVYVAFSGGKDSTVLLDIVRRIYPDVPAVFSDTGLEFPEVREFVKSCENVTIVRPEMNFRKVIEVYGYPVISKRVADTVEYGHKPGSFRWKELHGEIMRSNGTPSEFNCEKWCYLLDAPFKVSSRCCTVMKKRPKDQFDVCMEIKAFKAGAQSTAFCTNRLKTEPFHKWLSEHYPANPPEVRDDISLVYGFDANEQHRIRRRVGIMAAMGYQTEYPLTWEVRTIHDIEEVGIERPKTYSIFNHANCTGCLKAGKQHWFVVYCLYPKIWEKAKLAEDTIGYSILKQGYLSDFEAEFAKLKEKALPPTEKAKPQTFWAAARKLIRDDDDLPCECSF
jgi:3'-phosphoadenosine 5'-phosphosulfate sulfotransferase (PAPS reductase)/FAD synthetase